MLIRISDLWTEHAVQASCDSAARRHVRGPTCSCGVHLPRRGERQAALTLLLPQDCRSTQGQRTHSTIRGKLFYSSNHIIILLQAIFMLLLEILQLVN